MNEDTMNNSDIESKQLEEHQKVVDNAIKLLKKNYISNLTKVSKHLKRIIRKENCNDAKTIHNANIVTIKLAYLYYVLDSLKSYKYFKEYNNHPLAIKSVDNAINLIENKEVISFIKKVNKDIFDALFTIPDNIREDALKQVACGECKSTTLKEIRNRHLILRPSLSVLCSTCGQVSLIEFGKEEDN